MHKHQDYHFGNSSPEVLFKAACWALSFAMISKELKATGTESISVALALSMFVFSASCFSNTFFPAIQKKSIFAKVIFLIFSAGLFYTSFFSFTAAVKLTTLQSDFANNFQVVYYTIIGYMTFDILFLVFDPPINAAITTTEAQDRHDKFIKNLKEEA